MGEPIAADKKPMVIAIEVGTHFYCACGRSANQPFCDGSHQGTGLLPMRFEVEKPGNAAICMCRGSGNKPYCDGSHSDL